MRLRKNNIIPEDDLTLLKMLLEDKLSMLESQLVSSKRRLRKYANINSKHTYHYEKKKELEISIPYYEELIIRIKGLISKAVVEMVERVKYE